MIFQTTLMMVTLPGRSDLPSWVSAKMILVTVGVKVAFEVGDDVKGPNPNGASFVTSGDVEVGLVLAKA